MRRREEFEPQQTYAHSSNRSRSAVGRPVQGFYSASTVVRPLGHMDAFLLGVDKIAFCRRSTRDTGTSCGPMGSTSQGRYTNEYRLLAAVLLYFGIPGDVPGALGSSRMFDWGDSHRYDATRGYIVTASRIEQHVVLVGWLTPWG